MSAGSRAVLTVVLMVLLTAVLAVVLVVMLAVELLRARDASAGNGYCQHSFRTKQMGYLLASSHVRHMGTLLSRACCLLPSTFQHVLNTVDNTQCYTCVRSL